jgi:ubiquinone/menaquinone biosynthesis C-methylase UbiE
MKRDKQTIIDSFVNNFPVTHALPRACEAIALSKLNYKKPILDLGCGDGQFTLYAFGKNSIDIGVDKNKKNISEAKALGVYKMLIASNAQNIPLKSSSINTIISNSVLEHVDDLGKVLKECFRLLKKEGRLIITVPTPLVCQYQFWSKFIPFYRNFKKAIWKHKNYFNKKGWIQELQKAGFKIIKLKTINSRPTIMWADVFFPVWFLGPMPKFLRFLKKQRVFVKKGVGATLLIISQK